MRRLHGPYSDAQLEELYQRPWSADGHTPDHRLRLAVTADVGRWIVAQHGLRSGADLSAGDGRVITDLGLSDVHIGDLAHGHPICGPVEETIHQIPIVDLFVLSETLEHVEKPAGLLEAIRKVCRYLLLTTPLDETVLDNVEHIWGWSKEDIAALLAAAGFAPILYVECDFRPHGFLYAYQMWVAK